jgi:hypothetical protein
MRKAAALPFAVAAALSLNALAQTPAPASHPILGQWEWTRPENKCTELYDFRADGTVPVTSGAEKTDNTYTIAPKPDASGFYRLTMKTLKDYGGKDCTDDASDSAGQETTNYVLFDPTRTMHIVCVEPKVDRCFGPLKRAGQ